MVQTAKAFSLTIASGVSLSSALDLGYGWNHVAVSIPTMASGSDINFFAAEAAGGTYRKLYHAPNTASAAVAYTITSGITNCILPLNVRAQNMKIQLTTATSDTAYTFYFVCTGAQ